MKSQLMLAITIVAPVLFGGSISQPFADDRTVVYVDDDSDGKGWLGVSIQDMTESLAKSMDVQTKEGALVNDVVDESPAEKAGLEDEDIIVEFDGAAIASANDLIKAVRKTKPGTKVNVTVMRDKKKVMASATIDKAPKERSFAYSFSHPRAPRPPREPRPPRAFVWRNGSGSHGLVLEELNEQLAEYFEAPNKRGVLVEEVKKESAAEKAGFRAGDVIIKAGTQSVEDVHDVTSELSEHKKGEKVDFEVVRKGSRKTLSLEVQSTEHSFLFDSPHGMHWESGDGDDDEEFFLNDDLDEMKIELENIKPELERIKPELEKIKPELDRMRIEIKEKVNDALKRAFEMRKGIVEA
ncbi:MAG TPA: PDZ domain-containing protein [Bacteroidota bacterium]